MESLSAKELRIGNWVEVLTGFGQVGRIDELSDGSFSGVVSNENDMVWDRILFKEDICKPLPLCESILNNSEFKELKDIYDDIEKAWYYGEYQFYVIYNKGKFYLGLEHQDYHKEIEFVHQLQNIVYYLFDVELKIKP